MNALFVCNTPYQILVASHIVWCSRDDLKADIVITDWIAHWEGLYERLSNNSGIFDEVFFLKKDCFAQRTTGKLYKALSYYSPRIVEKEISFKKKYDVFFSANETWVNCRLYAYLTRFNNKNIKVSWYEDSVGIGVVDKEVYEPDSHTRRVNLVKKILGKSYLAGDMKEIYLFHPEFLHWNPKFDLVKLRQIDIDDQEYKKNINHIFGYTDFSAIFSKKVIYFEDGLSEWHDNEDIKLLKLIAGEIGIENIIVKRHPRNREDRFSSEGFHTNEQTEIPWEVIAMNVDLNNTVCITKYSVAAVTPYILFGSQMKAIILAKLEAGFGGKRKDFFDYIHLNIYGKRPDLYYVPENAEELAALMQDLFR